MLFVKSNNFQKNFITHIAPELSLSTDPVTGYFMTAIYIFCGHIEIVVKKYMYFFIWPENVLKMKVLT